MKDLRTDLRDGQSIAQVAQSKNVDPKTVVDAIVKAGDAKIDSLASSGKISAERAAKMKDRLPHAGRPGREPGPEASGRLQQLTPRTRGCHTPPNRRFPGARRSLVGARPASQAVIAVGAALLRLPAAGTVASRTRDRVRAGRYAGRGTDRELP